MGFFGGVSKQPLHHFLQKCIVFACSRARTAPQPTVRGTAGLSQRKSTLSGGVSDKVISQDPFGSPALVFALSFPASLKNKWMIVLCSTSAV